MSENKLRFTTLALRRALASEHDELAPVVSPQLAAYGTEERTRAELELALSELPDEARPATVARLLLPDGVRLEQVEVELTRTELTGRLARAHRATITVVVVPEPRVAADPAGHWVFVPVVDHACYVARNEDLKQRLSAELAVFPAALALDLDGWKRMMTWAEASLEPLEVELATTRSRKRRGAGRSPRRSASARRPPRSRARAASSRQRPNRRRSSAAPSSSPSCREHWSTARGAACCSSATRPPASRHSSRRGSMQTRHGTCGRRRRASSSRARAASASGRHASLPCSPRPRRSTRSSTSTISARCSPIARAKAASTSARRSAATSWTAAYA